MANRMGPAITAKSDTDHALPHTGTGRTEAHSGVNAGVRGDGARRWRRRTVEPAGESDVRLSTLFRELADDARRLVRDEVELAKLETRTKLGGLAKDGGLLAAGALVAAVGGVCLVIALALGLGALFGAYWLGTLVTGVLLLLVGGVIVLKGVQPFRTGDFKPRHTIETLKDDAAWARQEARGLKRERSGG